MLYYNSYCCDHPFNNLLSRYKVSSERLRNRSIITPSVNTERFKRSFFKRQVFKIDIVDIIVEILDFRILFT